MATSAPVPSLENLTAALELLEIPEATLRSFRETAHQDLSWDFTEALCESPNTIVTDWRFAVSDALREIFLRLYPAGIKALIETEDEETFNPKTIFLQVDGVSSRYRVKIPKKPDLHEVVFAFRSILPHIVRIYALARYDGTDTYAHVVKPKETWLQVDGLLGPWFQTVFREHPVKPLFKKVGKDVKPKRDFLKKCLKQSGEWLARQRTPFEDMYQEDLDTLRKNLDSPRLRGPGGLQGLRPEIADKKRQEWRELILSPRRLLLLQNDLWGSLSGAEGLHELWNGNRDGWKKIRRALEHFLWRAPVVIRFRPGNEYFGLGDFGNKLALAITLQEWEMAEYFCRQMLRVKKFYLERSPLSRFLLKLYGYRNPAIYDGADKPAQTFGVYGLVFAAWDDPAKLAGALDVACDYHMMRIGDDHEFSCEPFYAFAAEILAICRIRQELGLETPQIEHQLLDAPWRELPDRVPLERDPFLEKLVQVIKEEVPDLLPQ